MVTTMKLPHLHKNGRYTALIHRLSINQIKIEGLVVPSETPVICKQLPIFLFCRVLRIK